jgi:hypothetical protein
VCDRFLFLAILHSSEFEFRHAAQFLLLVWIRKFAYKYRGVGRVVMGARQLQQHSAGKPPRNPPTVICPGCKQKMRLVQWEPLLFTERLAELTYKCERCETTTKRAVKED